MIQFAIVSMLVLLLILSNGLAQSRVGNPVALIRVLVDPVNPGRAASSHVRHRCSSEDSSTWVVGPSFALARPKQSLATYR